MTELALTRIFSVVMYYHFAFLAISIALFGLSASGVFAYVARRRLDRYPTDTLLAAESLIYAVCTIVALFVLVRLRVGLNYSPQNLALMLDDLRAGRAAVLHRRPRHHAGHLAAVGADQRRLRRRPDRRGRRLPGPDPAARSARRAGRRADRRRRWRLPPPSCSRRRAARARVAGARRARAARAARRPALGLASFDVVDTKGHQGDRVLFSKWNSFSRIGVYERTHGDWSLSPAYKGPLPDTRFMDIDSAASTPILGLAPDLSNAQYLRYELTALAYHLKERARAQGSGIDPEPLTPVPSPKPEPGFTALVIGPGGGRDLVSALVFGAARVDGVEINPIIANDVMRDRFREFSGGIYTHPRVRIAVDDGRSFVRRTPERYDVIQASLVDTWAATAAGAYTLTENTLYTVEAFNDYLDHLTDDGVLTITRWVFDGLRLVSLAQAACEPRGWDAAIAPGHRPARSRRDVPAEEDAVHAPTRSRRCARSPTRLGFDVLYAPGVRRREPPAAIGDGRRRRTASTASRRPATTRGSIRAADREQFYASYRAGHPADDRRPAVLLSHDEARAISSRSRSAGRCCSATG